MGLLKDFKTDPGYALIVTAPLLLLGLSSPAMVALGAVVGALSVPVVLCLMMFLHGR